MTCDAYCEGCYYYGPAHRTCDYWEKEDKLRGCPAGAGCDKKITEKEHRKMSFEGKWDKDAGKQMWLQGKSDKEIAEAFGVSSTAVYQIRKKYWEPSASAEVAEEVPAQDPAQSYNHEQRENDVSEDASTEALGGDDSKIMIRALELMTARLTGMDAVMTAHVVTTMYNWTDKEDLLMAREALDYLIARCEK